MNRKKFLQLSAITGIGAVFTPQLIYAQDKKQPHQKNIRLIHTSDLHLTERSSQVQFEALKIQVQQLNPQLLVDSGDVFSTFETSFEDRLTSLKKLEALGFNCLSFGNQELQLSKHELNDLIALTSLQWIVSNMNPQLFHSSVQPYKILTLNDLKIGIAAISGPLNRYTHSDYTTSIENQLNIFSENLDQVVQQKCDKIICLAHEFPKEFNPALGKIDLILSGRTHQTNVQFKKLDVGKVVQTIESGSQSQTLTQIELNKEAILTPQFISTNQEKVNTI